MMHIYLRFMRVNIYSNFAGRELFLKENEFSLMDGADIKKFAKVYVTMVRIALVKRHCNIQTCSMLTLTST